MTRGGRKHRNLIDGPVGSIRLWNLSPLSINSPLLWQVGTNLSPSRAAGPSTLSGELISPFLSQNAAFFTYILGSLASACKDSKVFSFLSILWSPGFGGKTVKGVSVHRSDGARFSHRTTQTYTNGRKRKDFILLKQLLCWSGRRWLCHTIKKM